ncbi:hypothetical protein OBBRIDRAFT_829258, partial [Obba rivulosa]
MSPSEPVLPYLVVFDDILYHLRTTPLPQTQQRVVYASVAGDPLGSTLMLYCLIEGGDFYIDQAVQELVRRVNADIAVVDAIDMVSTECDHFDNRTLHISLLVCHILSPG